MKPDKRDDDESLDDKIKRLTEERDNLKRDREKRSQIRALQQQIADLKKEDQ